MRDSDNTPVIIGVNNASGNISDAEIAVESDVAEELGSPVAPIEVSGPPLTPPKVPRKTKHKCLLSVFTPAEAPSPCARVASAALVAVVGASAFSLYVRTVATVGCPSGDHQASRGSFGQDVRSVAAVVSLFSTTISTSVMLMVTHPPSNYTRAVVRCMVLLWIGSVTTLLARTPLGFSLWRVGFWTERLAAVFSLCLLLRRLRLLEESSGQLLNVDEVRRLFCKTGWIALIGNIALYLHQDLGFVILSPETHSDVVNTYFGVALFSLTLVLCLRLTSITVKVFTVALAALQIAPCVPDATESVDRAVRTLRCERAASIAIFMSFASILLTSLLYYICMLLEVYCGECYSNFSWDWGSVRFAFGSLDTCINAWAIAILSGALCSQKHWCADKYTLLDGEARMQDIGGTIVGIA